MSSKGKRGTGQGGGGNRGGKDRGQGGGGNGGEGGGGSRIEDEQKNPPIFDPTTYNQIARVDETVTAKENNFIGRPDDIAAMAAKLSVRDGLLPTRPAYGTKGEKFAVFANYFRAEIKKDVVLFHYSTNISRKTASDRKMTARKKKRVIELLLEEHQDSFPKVASDFAANIVSLGKLMKIGESKSFRVRFREEREDTAPPENAEDFDVNVVYVRTLQVDDLIKYMSGTSLPDSQKLDIIQALNIVAGHDARKDRDTLTVASHNHFALNRLQFSVDEKKYLSKGLSLLPGYFRSIRPSSMGLLVNANVSHAVMYTPAFLDRLMEFEDGAMLKNLPDLHRLLKGVKVRRCHLKTRRNEAGQPIPDYRTIWGLATTNDGIGEPNGPRVKHNFAGPKDVSFHNPKLETGDGYETVFAYFERKYPDYKFVKNYPVVNVGSVGKPIYLPSEACIVVPGQQAKSTLHPDQQSKMIKIACKNPGDNAASIVSTAREVLKITNKDPTISDFKLSVQANLVIVPARRLAAPQICMVINGKLSLVPALNGSWNLRDRTLWKIKDQPNSLGVLAIRSEEHKNISQRDLEVGLGVFRETLTSLGLQIARTVPRYFTIDDSRGEPSSESLSQLEPELEKLRAKFVLVVLPYMSTKIYAKIKTFADTRLGIHTVCVIGSKFIGRSGVGPDVQYMANLALKFNLKLGGSNHGLEPMKLGVIKDGSTMVVGLDVTHPSPGSAKDARSVAGIVASIDSTLAQWPGKISIQEGNEEMVTALEKLMASRLILWREKNGGQRLPDNILIYRDGVSEGQYQTVLTKELPSIRKACTKMYPADSQKAGLPRISIVIVGKRHHTRFYPTNFATADKLKANCRNGTIVDRGVTEMQMWDFFLQAHECIQGTARPAHYVVILDEIFRQNSKTAKATSSKGTLPRGGLSRGSSSRSTAPPSSEMNVADNLQDLTHNMCYLYARATRAVSICPPAYYADLLCERARCYLKHRFNPGTNEKVPVQPDDELVKIHENIKDSMFYL